MREYAMNINEDVFIPSGVNPYGFRLNINHPKVNELYRRYLKWKGISPNLPLSDKNRLEFESYILQTKEFKRLLQK